MLSSLFGMMGGSQKPAAAVRGARAAVAMNLPEIENALTRFMDASTRPDAEDFADKEPLSDDIIRRMMSGYAYVDGLVREGVDLFSYGSSNHWLELNHLVLCGATPERREQFRHHIEETERKFYNDSVGGIGERIEWLLRHRSSSPEALAGGIFVLIASAPQLYIEGNCRTATLIASYALAWHGLPPLVVTERNSRTFFTLTDACKQVDRRRWDQALLFRRESVHVEQFIRETTDPRYLAAEGQRPA